LPHNTAHSLSCVSFSFFQAEAHGALVEQQEHTTSDEVYSKLGLGDSQKQLLFSFLRGWNSAILASTVYGFIVGPSDVNFFLLLSLLSGGAATTHALTARMIAKDPALKQTVGVQESLRMSVFTGLQSIVSLYMYMSSPARVSE